MVWGFERAVLVVLEDEDLQGAEGDWLESTQLASAERPPLRLGRERGLALLLLLLSLEKRIVIGFVFGVEFAMVRKADALEERQTTTEKGDSVGGHTGMKKDGKKRP